MQSKKIGGPRFSGRGTNKWDPKPGSVEFYRANLPLEFSKVTGRIASGLGISYQEAEKKAALVMSWSEKPLAKLIERGALDNPHRCPSCATPFEHTDKPFPAWDNKQKE